MRQKGIIKWLSLKYNYTSCKMKWTMQVAVTKMKFNGPDIKESRKKCLWLKYAFYGKTKQQMNVGSTKIQPDGSDKKELETEVNTKK